MTEDEPYKSGEEMEPTKAPLEGPNVTSTFDTPPSADAVRAHDAAMRRHLQGKRPPQEPSEPS